MFLPTAERHQQPDSPEALMREVGAHLRQVRLERGEELEQVSQYLRIRLRYLEALEAGDLSIMPGRTYALGFLRSYADYLGFNGNELVARIRNAVGDLTDRTRLRVRTPLPESRLPKAPVLVLSLAAAVGAYAGWIYLHGSGEAVVETVPEVPAELRQMALEALPPAATENALAAPVDPTERPGAESEDGALAPEPTPAAAAEAGTGARALPADKAEDEQPAPTVALANTEPALAPQAVPQEAAPIQPELDQNDAAAPAADADARVILRARDISWIRISSPSGDYESSRTLQPGEIFLVPNRADLNLWTGNAGGLEVVVDGLQLPALGPDGEVVREISLDPSALLARAEPELE